MRKWSELETARAIEMKAEGRSYKEIAEYFDRGMWGVRAHLTRLALGEDERRERERANWQRRKIRERFRPLDRPSTAPDQAEIERALDARDLRLMLLPRDLTAAILGDPLPGYSALERR